ncbi:hypothetical protein FSZ31_12460 [Sphingorhabdus soli]|uniref:ABM domain-containing protein n=1 Tax=Flavisphingopyxis soli TaxID=2601267 RepID=A0A5C6U4M0_9SPHN|nr:hypothetical protein [Sphingorhabdus soli]TXC67779.1 hypothetical protein FSZ31_12460 [Sphingorhabdus soli]
MSLIRIDTFTLPPAAFDKLHRMICVTLECLAGIDGNEGAEIFFASTSRDRIATIVRWRDASVAGAARDAVMATHREHGFDATAFYDEHSIQLQRSDYDTSEPFTEQKHA